MVLWKSDAPENQILSRFFQLYFRYFTFIVTIPNEWFHEWSDKDTGEDFLNFFRCDIFYSHNEPGTRQIKLNQSANVALLLCNVY